MVGRYTDLERCGFDWIAVQKLEQLMQLLLLLKSVGGKDILRLGYLKLTYDDFKLRLSV